MVASGVISESLSKELVLAVKRHYPNLISWLAVLWFYLT
jgi:hypothetical protein